MSDKINLALDTITKALKDLAEGREGSISNPTFVEFKSNDTGLYGKGFIWSGEGNSKQIVFNGNPDRFFISENIELGKDKSVLIDNSPVLSAHELGNSVTKSNLRQLGRLKGLLVDGDVVIDQYVFYKSTSSRIGIGIEMPNSALSVAEEGLEIVIGAENSKGKIGTFASNDLNIVTDNTPRITVEASGNIKFGNKAEGPIQVSVHGKLSIGVQTMDSRADLHIKGPIKFNDKLHQYKSSPPEFGSHERGDIVWNSEPEKGKSVGWICVRSGEPGEWLTFGEIKG